MFGYMIFLMVKVIMPLLIKSTSKGLKNSLKNAGKKLPHGYKIVNRKNKVTKPKKHK